MDLCLRGSQINLVTRQKPKAKYASNSNILQLPAGYAQRPTRPRSATLHQRRSRSTPFLYRPQSAEPANWSRRFGSACSQYYDDVAPSVTQVKGKKRYQSVSSSNLLKLLLDEPIKRSWLCRTGSGHSPDNQSELSSSRRTASNCSLYRPQHSESLGSSSAEGEKPLRNWQGRSANMSANTAKEKHSYNNNTVNNTASNSNSAKAYVSSDYWSVPGKAKPDLPGRVSFSKASSGTAAIADLDSSDCDNDKQLEAPTFNSLHATASAKEEHISAPGPVSMPSFQSAAAAPTTSSVADVGQTTVSNAAFAATKKTVHFVAAGSGSAEVYAETYEYPKCPSENCSCSTRSSSTASLHDVLEGTKCACAALGCRYALDGSVGASKSAYSGMSKSTEDNNTAPLPPIEESAVIREYKNAVAEQLENSIVKNLLLDEGSGGTKAHSYSQLNNVELPSYLEKYSAPVKSADTLLEKQNNLSEPKSAVALYKPAKHNLLNSIPGSSNELHGKTTNITNGNSSTALTSSTSESVINNYLKVTGAASALLTNKKDNNSKSSVDVLTRIGSASAKPGSLSKARASKMRKATSFSSLREDANLNEFHLDKVDSWMSMHQEAMTAGLSGGGDSTSKAVPKLPNGSLGLKDAEEAHAAYAKLKQSLHIAMSGAKAGEGEDEDEDGGEDDSASQLTSKSEGNSQDDSTYNEIVSVIKEIEEDKKQDNYAERTGSVMELKLHTPNNEERIERQQQRGGGETPASTHTPDTPDKYKDILNYLDNVEDSCDKTLLETRRSMPESNRSKVEFVVEPDIAEDVPKLADLLMLPNHQLARRVIALSLRANELANAVLMSKEHVSKIREEKQKSLRAEKAAATSRVREQKKHYEEVVKRHQGFIEQLLKDKGSLCEKVAALTRRLESQNQAWQHKLDTEVQRAKETSLAGEKIRRERWVRENTKRIKELTVKGLEAEINKMSNTHEQAMSELKRVHKQHMIDALEEARAKHEQVEHGIREACAQDRETIIEKERAAIRERFERQLEEEQRGADEQRQKLCEDYTAERERLQQQLKAKDVDYQQRRNELQREKACEMEQALGELQEKMSKQEEKYQNRINTIEKQYESDFAIWKREYENSCRLAQVEKENTIRQHYRAERDRQIDAIVSRMDAEALSNSEEFESKVNRLKEKYEKDLAEAEQVERSLREKYAETRNKLAESDAQVRNSQAESKQLQIELEHSKKMSGDFLGERDQLRENLRREVQNEVTTLKLERDQEIQRIHKRVQQAIEKKDATIDILQKENGGFRERCLKLEAIIRQQRKDYCVK